MGIETLFKLLDPHLAEPLVNGRKELVLDEETVFELKLLEKWYNSPNDTILARLVSLDFSNVELLNDEDKRTNAIGPLLSLIKRIPRLRICFKKCSCSWKLNACDSSSSGCELRISSDEEEFIDLVCFHKLSSLTMCRAHLKQLKGLSNLKCQLVSLACDSSTDLDCLFCDQLTWAELTTIFLSRCAFTPVDNEIYFKNTPWLKKLTVKFCNLKDGNFFSNLEYLEYLDLSYNSLRCIPVLNPRCKLKTLQLMYNNVFDLSGIEKLPNLERLDLSYNWLPDKYSLAPMKHVESIIWINFRGTPLSFAEHYRIYVASSLSPNHKKRSDISIDGIILNPMENSVVGRLQFERKTNATNTPSTSGLGGSTSLVTRSKPKRLGKTANVRVPIIWDESVPEAERASPPKLEVDHKEVDLSRPIPTVSYSLNQERLAFEAIMRAHASDDPKEAKSPPSDRRSSPKSLQLHLEENTVPRFNPFNDDSPIPEIVPELVQAQVHAVDVDSKALGIGVEPTVASSDGYSPTSPVTSLVSQEERADDDASRAIFDKSENSIESSTNNMKQTEINDTDIISHSIDESENSVSASGLYTDTHPNREQEYEQSVSKVLETEGDVFKPTQPDQLTSGEEYSADSVTGNEDVPQDGDSTIQERFETEEDDSTARIESDEESFYESDDEDVFWQVTILEPDTKKTRPVMLALLANELKERCPKSGEILTKWSLDSVLSCVKTRNDPITIEMEFDSVKKERQHRVYIMEYADAKTLTKTVYNILESRPLIAMNQVSQECLKCSTIFVYTKPSLFKTKETAPSCPVCGSSVVAETEEPKLPVRLPPTSKPLSHSASHSSIVGHGAVTPSTCEASSPALESCSAISIEHSQKSGTANFKKYESDIEVISNPSQSSIEVIDESSRSQSVTPRRKMSDERQSALATESCIKETHPALSALTESSSSGSLTESVITAYESTSVIINKKPVESFLGEAYAQPVDNNVYSDARGTLEEENGNLNARKNPKDIYSFSDFVDVDLRVKTFIYHTIFNNENEEIRGLVRCHHWKTGGSDYDGCFVLSTTSVYFLYHNRTDFSEQICDWLSLNESYSITDVKRVQPIIWNQGVEIQIKEYSFILLLMDTERTQNLIKHFSNIALKGVKVISKPNAKVELALQQAVLTCDLRNTTEDPSVTHMVMCKSVEICKAEVSEEFLRLASLVVTSELFLLIPGELSWLCSASQPSIASSQDLPSLIEVVKKGTDLLLRFFNESEAIEEKWVIKLGTSSQLSPLVEAVRRPWERRFSVPLEVTGF